MEKRGLPPIDTGEDKIFIDLYDGSSGRSVQIPVNESDWTSLMLAFVQGLNGLGFIIDPIKAEEAISQLAESNRNG